jgi:branched-subunit amino acid transport protein
MMWIAVLIVGLGSFALRAVPLILGPRLRVAQRTQDVLQHAGIGGITALLVTSVAHIGPAGGATNALPPVAAVAVATVIARRGGSMVLVLLIGAAVFAATEFAVRCWMGS